VRVKEGSSRYWLALLIIDHGNPLTAVQVRGGAGTQALRHVDYNYWIAEPGAGPGPFTVDLTDNAGHRATIPGVTLSPGRIQTSTVRMYGSTPPKVTAAPARPASTAGPSRAAAVSAAASVEAFADAAPSGSARPVAPSGPRRCH
jgi:hypothetical protein